MHIFILTGAGISAESGIDTFRASDGLWENHRIEDVATPEGFARNPKLVQDFYDMRRAAAARAQPNPAHQALARLAQAGRHRVTLVTQNVDDLHERGGSPDVIHMHGTLNGALCAACGHRWPAPATMSPKADCPACGHPTARPDIVWFGEIPYFMDRIDAALSDADLFAAIGTSGQVYPAAGFVQAARGLGIPTVELNLEPTASGLFSRVIPGPAGQTVPLWVDELLTAPA